MAGCTDFVTLPFPFCHLQTAILNTLQNARKKAPGDSTRPALSFHDDKRGSLHAFFVLFSSPQTSHPPRSRLPSSSASFGITIAHLPVRQKSRIRTLYAPIPRPQILRGDVQRRHALRHHGRPTLLLPFRLPGFLRLAECVILPDHRRQPVILPLGFPIPLIRPQTRFHLFRRRIGTIPRHRIEMLPL